MCLERRAGIVQRRGDEDDAPTGRAVLAIIWVLGSRFYEVGKRGFESIIRAQDVDFDHGFESIG